MKDKLRSERRLPVKQRRTLTLQNATPPKWISCVANRTQALRRMTDHSAFGVCATRSRTRVFTLLTHASQVARTFAVADAFRFTEWWNSNILRQTRTRRAVAGHFALGVRSTRRWHTRVFRFRWRQVFGCEIKKHIT